MSLPIEADEILPALRRLQRNPRALLSGAEEDAIETALAIAAKDLNEADALRTRLTGILQSHRGEWERRMA